MGRQRKPHQGRAPAPQAGRRVPVAALVAGLAALIAIGLWLSRTPDPGFEKLVGRWERADGGYILEVKRAEADGRLEASYLNPSPIHVAQATASRQGTSINVFVELRDVNYPGSTYTLVYDPENDKLEGTYFQALQQQRFSVVFARRP
jgi:hypothetical protein